MSIAICPGSFDPITLGHLDIITRASEIFDTVVVCVMNNASKTSHMFSVKERVDMIQRSVAGYNNISVDAYSGLLVEYAARFDGAVVVKGLRAASDFDYEFQMNLVNKRLNAKMETMFLTANENFTFLSSSIVREMAQYGADFSGLVPDAIIDDIIQKAKLWRLDNG